MVLPDSDNPMDLSVFERHLETGGEYLRENRNQEARAEFAAALALKPEDRRALALQGLACFRMGDFEAALPIYQSLVTINSNDASYWLNLGLVHLKLNDAAAAIMELERSRDLDPSQSRAVSYLGLAYARCGKYAQAYQAFLQAGDKELAREMEQYLSEDERSRIKDAVPHGDQRALSGGHRLAPPAAASTPAEVEELSEADVELVDEPAEAATAADRTEPTVRPENMFDAVFAKKPSGPVIRPGRSLFDDEDENKDGAAASAPAAEGRGAITLAVEQALPSSAAAAGAGRVAVGHEPPMPLSEFATSRLIRPEDGDHTFETSAGGVLIVRVRDRVYTRTEGVNATGGDLKYEIASRRVRGSSTGEAFSLDGRAMFSVSGNGHMVVGPLGEHFSLVSLDDDILYLREGVVFAFEERVRWENGHVPGSKASLPMVQFRGQGEVAFRSKRPLLAIKLAPERVLYIDARVLAGWIGRVVPRAVAPKVGGETSSMFVECTGEGVVLLEEEESDAEDWSRPSIAGMKPKPGAKLSAGES
ncbi:protein of unknown function DUF124 [Haliangium ochraceum DSM 14365]|uniref:Uncharacterized protein n=1 Tax=Haliangium ochraceum (strain DSM 14365 / JCM 11303 / SMP-2) TaxID=502025 RepID=D0LPW8_HALO1|nr:protein of unknown function DUF124 [Haliangium ochraceum DSM 14365]